MKIMLTRTGDPWMDWGLVGMYHYAVAEDRLFQDVDLTPGHLTIKTRDRVPEKKYIQSIFRHLQNRMNDLVLPAPEMKALGLEHRVAGENGFYDPAHAVTLNKQQKAVLKDKLNNITAKPEVTLRRNYVGLKNDWRKLAGELNDVISAFFVQHRGEGKIKGSCGLCGRVVPQRHVYKMRQNKNPFYNQHHNNRVRGHANTVTTGEMCPTCNLLNIFAAVQANTPYFISDDRTHVILPRVDDLTVLYKIFSNIKSRLVDLLGGEVTGYATNIRDLRQRSLYHALTGVYFNIVHRYLLENDDYILDPVLEDSEQDAVFRWVVLRYRKGQNVSFAHFNHLEVHPRLFDLVRKLDYGTRGDRQGNIYTTFLGGVWCKEPQVVGDIARGIIQREWSRVAKSFLALLKEYRRSGNRVLLRQNALYFFERFLQYAMVEVDCMLDEKLAGDLKSLGRTFGEQFKGDIAFFTSLNNAPDTDAFREVLREAFFKLYKVRLAAGKKDKKDKDEGQQDKFYVPSETTVENILNSIGKENLGAVKDTLLIYACIWAMRKLEQDKAKNRAKEEK